jgi:3-hydroxyisobutyrate dehydrogenase-like beta-hydroxyacid dehydrogenase
MAQIGLLHPGEMGAAVGAALNRRGHDVVWASSGRSDATVGRATRARLRDVANVDELARASEAIFSICPPHAAADVARSVRGFEGVYVDANAVSPATARAIASELEAAGARFVDGGIIGPPPPPSGRTTRLYLSGAAAGSVAELFDRTMVEARVLSAEPGTASALKMAYSAWSKGTAALLLAIRELARAEDVETPLLDAWSESSDDLPERSRLAGRSAARKGWRWVGEMEEIAATFAAAGLPGGFHEAAAEIFRRAPRLDEAAPDEETLERVLAALR